MQTKIIETDLLRKKFQFEYQVNINERTFNEDTILAGTPIVFALREHLIDFAKENEAEPTSINNYNEICQSILRNLIQKYIENHEIEIETIKSNKLYIFKKKNKIVEHKNKIVELNKILYDYDRFCKLIKVEFHNYDDIVRVPQYQLLKNNPVYLVIQDPSDFFKIVKAQVKQVYLYEETSKDDTPYFEFYYDIQYNQETRRISAKDMQNFDGNKCLVNYNLALFTTPEEAQEHALKVLEGVKNSINEKIRLIKEFKP